MSILKQLKQELRDRRKLDNLSKGNLIALESAWLKDNVEKYGKCDKCGRIVFLTIDHIIPKDLLKQFGIDVERTFIEENLQMYCNVCNSFKGNKLDFANPKTKELLLKMLEEL